MAVRLGADSHEEGGAWTVVLAAGDGKRLRSVTTRADGTPVPKQFCTFGGRKTLLGATLDRARLISSDQRIVPVVAEAHRPWWTQELADIPGRNVVVQPKNRGTASGILLPLLRVLSLDATATVAILPSDHQVDSDLVLLSSIRDASCCAREEPTSVFLLGIAPEAPDTSYGWIVPTRRSRGVARGVMAFVEKPARSEAVELMRDGASWSSFIMVGTVGAFLHLFATATPALLRAFLDAASRPLADDAGEPQDALRELYDRLTPCDFSRDVLQSERTREALRVVPVPHCGWSDLGTPARVARWQDAHATA